MHIVFQILVLNSQLWKLQHSKCHCPIGAGPCDTVTTTDRVEGGTSVDVSEFPSTHISVQENIVVPYQVPFLTQ